MRSMGTGAKKQADVSSLFLFVFQDWLNEHTIGFPSRFCHLEKPRVMMEG